MFQLLSLKSVNLVNITSKKIDDRIVYKKNLFNLKKVYYSSLLDFKNLDKIIYIPKNTKKVSFMTHIKLKD